jgi:hypothetical protein
VPSEQRLRTTITSTVISKPFVARATAAKHEGKNADSLWAGMTTLIFGAWMGKEAESCPVSFGNQTSATLPNNSGRAVRFFRTVTKTTLVCFNGPSQFGGVLPQTTKQNFDLKLVFKPVSFGPGRSADPAHGAAASVGSSDFGGGKERGGRAPEFRCDGLQH